MSFLYDILPAYTKSISTKTDTNITGKVNSFEEYLKTYDTEIFGMAKSAITELMTFKDVSEIDEKYLPYYAYLLGYEWNTSISSDIQRNFIINIIDLYKRKGTFFSLNYLLHQIDESVAMYEPEVDRFIVNQSMASGSSKFEDIIVLKFITTIREYVIITKNGLYTTSLDEFWKKRLDTTNLKEIVINLDYEEFLTYDENNIYVSKDCHEWDKVASISKIIDIAWVDFISSYIATSANDGIHLSTDGSHWFKVSDISGGNNIVRSNDCILISVINRGIFRTTDGFDWKLTLEKDVINNLIYIDVLGYFVAASNERVYTSDNGKEWDSYQNLTDIKCGLYVSPISSFFVGRPDGVYSSTDNTNWTKRLDIQDVTALHYSNIETFSITTRIYVGTKASGLWYSIDGKSFEKLVDIPNITKIVSTTSMSDGRSQILVFTDDDVYASELGVEWKVVSQIKHITGAVYSSLYDKFYVSTKLGVFYSDFGDNWLQCLDKTATDAYSTTVSVNTFDDLLKLQKGQVFKDSIVRVTDEEQLYIVSNDSKLLSDDFLPTKEDNAFNKYFIYFNYYSTAIQSIENLLNNEKFSMLFVGTKSHGMYESTDGLNFTHKNDISDVSDIQNFLFDMKNKVVVDSLDGYNSYFTPLPDSVDGGDSTSHILDDIDGYSSKNNSVKQYIVICTLEGIYYTDDGDIWQQGANNTFEQSQVAIKVIDEDNNINITCKIVDGHYVVTEYIDDEGNFHTSKFDTIYKAVAVLYSENIDIFIIGSYNGIYVSYDGEVWNHITNDKVLYLYEYIEGIGDRLTDFLMYNTKDNVYASENGTEWMVIHRKVPYNFTIPTENTINAYNDFNIYYSEDFIRWADQYPVPNITKAILKLVGDAETRQSSRVFALSGLPALYDKLFREKDVILTKVNKNNYLKSDGTTALPESDYHDEYVDTLIDSDVYVVNERNPSLSSFKERDVILTNGEISMPVNLKVSNVYPLYILPNILKLFQNHDVVITIDSKSSFDDGVLAGTLDGVYESSDGKNWSKVLDCGTVYDLIYIGALNRYLVASYSGLYSSGEGRTWTRVIDTKNLTPNSLAFDTYMSNEVNVFVGTRDVGMYHSTDTIHWSKYKDCIANTFRENKHLTSPNYYSPGVIEIQYSNTIDGIDDVVNMVKPAGIYHIYKKYYAIYVNMYIRPESDIRTEWVNSWFDWDDYNFDIWADENIEYLNALQYNSGIGAAMMMEGHTFLNGTMVNGIDYPYYHNWELCYASKVNLNNDAESQSGSNAYLYRLNVQKSFSGSKEEFNKYVKNNNDTSLTILKPLCCYEGCCDYEYVPEEPDVPPPPPVYPIVYSNQLGIQPSYSAPKISIDTSNPDRMQGALYTLENDATDIFNNYPSANIEFVGRALNLNDFNKDVWVNDIGYLNGAIKLNYDAYIVTPVKELAFEDLVEVNGEINSPDATFSIGTYFKIDGSYNYNPILMVIPNLASSLDYNEYCCMIDAICIFANKDNENTKYNIGIYKCMNTFRVTEFSVPFDYNDIHNVWHNVQYRVLPVNGVNTEQFLIDNKVVWEQPYQRIWFDTTKRSAIYFGGKYPTYFADNYFNSEWVQWAYWVDRRFQWNEFSNDPVTAPTNIGTACFPMNTIIIPANNGHNYYWELIKLSGDNVWFGITEPFNNLKEQPNLIGWVIELNTGKIYNHSENGMDFTTPITTNKRVGFAFNGTTHIMGIYVDEVLVGNLPWAIDVPFIPIFGTIGACSVQNVDPNAYYDYGGNWENDRESHRPNDGLTWEYPPDADHWHTIDFNGDWLDDTVSITGELKWVNIQKGDVLNSQFGDLLGHEPPRLAVIDENEKQINCPNSILGWSDGILDIQCPNVPTGIYKFEIDYAGNKNIIDTYKIINHNDLVVSTEFVEDFTDITKVKNNWYTSSRIWDINNNGTTPDLVKIDTKNGEVILTACGDLNTEMPRTGSCLVSRSYFNVGRFEIVAKVPPLIGGCCGMWPLFQNTAYQGTDRYKDYAWGYNLIRQNDAKYGKKIEENQQISMFTPTHLSDTSDVTFQNARLSFGMGKFENEFRVTLQKFFADNKFINDGNYHTFVLDRQYKVGYNSYFAFFIDDNEIYKIEQTYDMMSLYTSNALRLWIGYWFPNNWAGNVADWDKQSFNIKSFKYTPASTIYYTSFDGESYPMEGLHNLTDSNFDLTQ